MENINGNQRELFDLAMNVLDANFAPPLLWDTAKLSSWYAVGLFARNQGDDVATANKLLHNSLTQQYFRKSNERNYGSFKQQHMVPFVDSPDSLWSGEIYDAYDPNNGLFVTMAGLIIHRLYPDLVDPEVWTRFQAAMYEACVGQAMWAGGKNGDDLYPSYSNPYLLRCLCSTYIGTLCGDEKMVAEADAWTQAAVDLWDETGSPGEYNSPTYAGVTMLALGLAQYCPPSSKIHQVAPRLLQTCWESLGEVYNPSLRNMAGPWDRAYGYCMTRYYTPTAAYIAMVTGFEDAPMPRPLNGSEHFSDAAMIPMQVLTAPFVEASLEAGVRNKLSKLYGPHTYQTMSRFPPHDKRARQYSFYVAEGINVGGVSFDEDQVGGPKGIDSQFCPAVIQWGSGKHGAGCGWLSLWPTDPCCSIVATERDLTVQYTPSRDFSATPRSNVMKIRIGAIPFFELTAGSFADGTCSLPGLDLRLSGNVVVHGSRSLTFSKKQKLYGFYYYELQYTFDRKQLAEDPTLVISYTQSRPPGNDLRF